MIRHPHTMNRLRPLLPVVERRDCDSCAFNIEKLDEARCARCGLFTLYEMSATPNYWGS